MRSLKAHDGTACPLASPPAPARPGPRARGRHVPDAHPRGCPPRAEAPAPHGCAGQARAEEGRPLVRRRARARRSAAPADARGRPAVQQPLLLAGGPGPAEAALPARRGAGAARGPGRGGAAAVPGPGQAARPRAAVHVAAHRGLVHAGRAGRGARHARAHAAPPSRAWLEPTPGPGCGGDPERLWRRTSPACPCAARTAAFHVVVESPARLDGEAQVRADAGGLHHLPAADARAALPLRLGLHPLHAGAGRRPAGRAWCTGTSPPGPAWCCPAARSACSRWTRRSTTASRRARAQ